MDHKLGSAALGQALSGLDAQRLRGMRRGIEKESLRVRPDGQLALTPHPSALGSALTHPGITTDFSESQLELITAAHVSAAQTLQELSLLHRFTYRVLAQQGDEMLWVSSMPCGLPTDETIPIARYGSSNVGRAKSVYRMGLSHRYGRRMQTISGIHYNWSLPGLSSEQYFGLIRNFRRHAFLLLYLFGASPAVCSSFVAGRPHELEPLAGPTLHMPHGTSLRMGRLGYQSDAQSSLAVSYNSLEGYAASLHDALTRPYAPYEAVGVRNPGGDYSQLSTTLLQIENEFYGTIRPKRTIFPGERPLHALRERGVEYVEVRLMDLDPFEPLGIAQPTMRFLDVFLLHCLLSPSPPDSTEEIAALGRNQHRTAARGREPGLTLERDGSPITLVDWGEQLLKSSWPIAQRLDEDLRGSPDEGAHVRAVEQALQAMNRPQDLPSARVLQALTQDHGGSFTAFVRARSAQTRQYFLDQPLPAAEQVRLMDLSAQSVRDQQRIESLDSLPFEIYRQQYISPERLGRSNALAV